MIDSDHLGPDSVGKHRRRVQFDPTINLGHILTFVGFIAAGSVAYFDLRERISVGELRDQSMAADIASEKIRLRDTLQDLREDMREVRRGVDDLNRRGRLGEK